MAANPDQLLMGPADLYYKSWSGDVASEPALVNDAPAVSADWADCGGTSGGATLRVNQTFSTLAVDQVVDTCGRRLTSREIQVATSLAEPTLVNLGRALNAPNVQTGGGGIYYEPIYSGIEATQVPYAANILDGFAPVQDVPNARRRIALRRTLSTEQIESQYTKDSQTLIPVTFTAHYAGASISPIKITDEQAA